MFQKKIQLFGNNIDPACSYCRFGKKNQDGSKILCEKVGVVAPSFFCRKFRYDPVKRVPARQAQLPEYDPSDFRLE